MSKPSNAVSTESLDVIWDALHKLQSISPIYRRNTDARWDEVCSAMTWITESLDLYVDDNGDYVISR